MEKESIKKVRYSKLNQIFTIEREVLTRGVKIKEVKVVTKDMSFRELMTEKILETSIPLEMITEIHSFQSYIPYREHIIDEVIRVGIKINEVRSITPTITFNNYIVNNILKNSIHIENDKNNINP